MGGSQTKSYSPGVANRSGKKQDLLHHQKAYQNHKADFDQELTGKWEEENVPKYMAQTH